MFWVQLDKRRRVRAVPGAKFRTWLWCTLCRDLRHCAGKYARISRHNNEKPGTTSVRPVWRICCAGWILGGSLPMMRHASNSADSISLHFRIGDRRRCTGRASDDRGSTGEAFQTYVSLAEKNCVVVQALKPEDDFQDWSVSRCGKPVGGWKVYVDYGGVRELWRRA